MADTSKIDEMTATFIATLSRFIEPESDRDISGQLGGEGDPGTQSSNIAWFSPGVPFSEEVLSFARVMFGNGDVSGEEYRSAITYFAELTRFLNTIPNLNESIGLEAQNRLAKNTGSLLDEQYANVLKFSEVADLDPDKSAEEKMNKLREKLVRTVVEKNIITDEKQEVLKPSPLVVNYDNYQQEYNMAWLNYTSKRRAAQIGNDKSAVIDWANNEQIYFNEVKRAYNKWVSDGYKNDYELLTSTIDQLGSRSLVSLKRDLVDSMTKARQVDPVSNLPFMFTAYYPSDFYSNTRSWLDFAFSHESYKGAHSETTNFGGGGLSLRLDFFGAPPGSKLDLSASGGDSTIKNSIDASGFAISFKIIQVMVSRPWFSPGFLALKNWRFNPEADFGLVSSGVPNSSEGMIPHFPVAAYFISNLKLQMNEFKKESSDFQRYVKAGGGISIGPIRIGGHGGRKEVDQKISIDDKDGTMVVEGMQLIALRCQTVQKSPNPDSNIKHWV